MELLNSGLYPHPDPLAPNGEVLGCPKKRVVADWMRKLSKRDNPEMYKW